MLRCVPRARSDSNKRYSRCPWEPRDIHPVQSKGGRGLGSRSSPCPGIGWAGVRIKTDRRIDLLLQRFEGKRLVASWLLCANKLGLWIRVPIRVPGRRTMGRGVVVDSHGLRGLGKAICAWTRVLLRRILQKHVETATRIHWRMGIARTGPGAIDRAQWRRVGKLRVLPGLSSGQRGRDIVGRRRRSVDASLALLLPGIAARAPGSLARGRTYLKLSLGYICVS